MEGLFKADAVNEEDPERDPATQVQKTCSARRRRRKVYSKLTHKEKEEEDSLTIIECGACVVLRWWAVWCD